jgi:hypothetical protein
MRNDDVKNTNVGNLFPRCTNSNSPLDAAAAIQGLPRMNGRTIIPNNKKNTAQKTAMHATNKRSSVAVALSLKIDDTTITGRDSISVVAAPIWVIVNNNASCSCCFFR